MEKTTIQLHKEQWSAYKLKKQFGLVVCGVRAGKTFLGAVWSQRKITEFPMGTGLMAAPTNKILQQATLEGFFNLFPEYRKYYRKQEGLIELPSGGKIYTRSTDEPLGLEGMTLNWAWLDEAGMMSRMVWVVIRARVSTTGGQVLITTTPYSMNWLYKEVYLPCLEGKDKDIEFFSWKSIDNPYFPKEFADKEKERMSPAEYAKRYEGKFVRLEGLVWNIDDSHIGKKEELENYLKYPERTIGGVDWGYTNPAGILIIKIKDGKYYVADEWKEAQRTTADIVQKCLEFNKEYFVQTWYPDPAEPDRIDEMRTANLTIGEVNKDIPLGVSKVEEMFRGHKLFILDNCKELQDEIAQYRFDIPKENRSGKEVPLAVNNHLCFAEGTIVNGKKIEEIGLKTGIEEVYEYEIAGEKIIGTPNHLIFTQRGLVDIDTLRYNDVIWKNKSLFMRVSNGIDIRGVVIGLKGITIAVVQRIKEARTRDYIDLYGKKKMELFPMDLRYITLTAIPAIIHLIILLSLTGANTLRIIGIKKSGNWLKKILRKLLNVLLSGQKLQKGNGGAEKSAWQMFISFLIGKLLKGNATCAVENIQQKEMGVIDSVILTAVKKRYVGLVPVYNVRTRNGMYLANNLLVSNCDPLRYSIVGNELGQSLTYQEEKEEKQRIMENRQSRKEFELL